MKVFKKILSSVAVLSLLAGSVAFVLRIRDITDWFKLRNYEPSSEIVSIADNSDLNSYGRRLFYVNYPELLDKTSFGKSCSVGEETIVLGCYVSNKKIYLFDVVEPKLEGVEEVTASHEMLHAAYDRLSPGDKDYVNQLLEDAYSRVTNERIIKNVNSYKSRDPNVVLNELHSILGTEVRDLPKDLENYYSKYFNNRNAVVTLAEAYEEEFESLETQIEAYDSQLSQINGQIVRIQAELETQNTSLKKEKDSINTLKSDVEAYNRAVVAYNIKVKAYNDDVNSAKALVEQYNSIVAERNKIAAQEVGLVEAIDTRQSEL